MNLTKEKIEKLKEFSTALDANSFTIVATPVEKGVETKEFQLEIAKNEFEQKMAAQENANFEKASISAIKSDLCGHIVVSGLTEDSLKAMKNDGISTTSVIQTGEKEFQAVIKVNAPKSQQETEKLEEIQRVLNERYGKGTVEKELAMPGLPYQDEKYVCNINSLNPAAPALGIARLMERIQEAAPLYPNQPKQEQGQERPKEQTKEQPKEATIIEQPTPGQNLTPQEQQKQPEQEKLLAEKAPDIVASILAALKAIINTVVKTVTLGLLQPFPNAAPQNSVTEQQKQPTGQQKPLQTKDIADLTKIPMAPALAPGIENAPFATPMNPQTLAAQIAREVQEKARAQEKTQQGQQKNKGRSKDRSRSGPSH